MDFGSLEYSELFPKTSSPFMKTRIPPTASTAYFNTPSFAVSSDFVAVAIRIFVNETVELATREFKFYNCAATVRKSENTP